MAGSAAPPPSPNAFLLRRRLRKELAAARQAAELTQAQAAEKLGVSLSTVIREELGTTGISPRHVLAYAEIYGLGDRANDLAELARAAMRLPWREYRDLLDLGSFEFFGYEASASLLQLYQGDVIPGLLQTPSYTACLLGEAFGLSAPEVKRHLALRRDRQRYAWEGETRHHFVLDEAVLRRLIGSPGVMIEQYEHVLDLMHSGAATIQVLPFAAGATFAVRGTFALVEFDDESDGVVYLEHSAGSRVIKDSAEMFQVYRAGFRRLVEKSLSGSASVGVLEALVTGRD